MTNGDEFDGGSYQFASAKFGGALFSRGFFSSYYVYKSVSAVYILVDNSLFVSFAVSFYTYH